MRKRRLILFDLDGTLVLTGGAGIRALNLTFLSLYGETEAMNGIMPAGKTDPTIIREIFQSKLKKNPSSEELRKVSEQYLWYLSHEINDQNSYRVVDGVKDLLDQLLARQDVLIALGTGNLEQGARIKLDPGGLNGYFQFGGYGSDSEDRSDVLRTAVKRAERETGITFSGKDVIVIGDTILDVYAGKAIGALTVAVGCGSGNPEDLMASNPDLFLKDFIDPLSLLNILN